LEVLLGKEMDRVFFFNTILGKTFIHFTVVVLKKSRSTPLYFKIVGKKYGFYYD
jgi:hypothetical protein